MRIPKILRWVFEAITFVGVTATTGCPHCAMVTIAAIGGVEHICDKGA